MIPDDAELLRQKMAAAVTRALGSSPQLGPLTEASLAVEYDEHTIWTVATAGDLTISAAVVERRWWVSDPDTGEETAKRIAAQLARTLRDEWDRWGG